MALVRKFEPSKLLDEGKHEGRITKLEARTEPYEYIDIYVEFPTKNGETMTIRMGCPDKLTKASRLGIVLQNFGVDSEDFETGIDLEELLVGKKVTCNTRNKTTDKGTFSEIDPKTLRPVKV